MRDLSSLLCKHMPSRLLLIATCLTAAIGMGTAAAFAAPSACPALGTWQAVAASATPTWQVNPDAGSAQISDQGNLRFDASLVSPALHVPESGLVLLISQRMDLSWANTSGVLEMRLPGSGWVDFIQAGGRFEKGGYNSESYSANPLGMRKAWGGNQAQRETRAVMPDQARGQSVELRFRIGSSGTGDEHRGWQLLDLHCQ